MSMPRRLTIAFAAFAAVGLLASFASAAEDGDEKQSPPALAPGKSVVVFPFDSVNISAGTARAAAEILEASLRDAGYKVVDWEPTWEEILEERGEAMSPPPQPAPAPQPAYPAPAPAQWDPAPPSVVVSETTPPPAPGTEPATPPPAAAPAPAYPAHAYPVTPAPQPALVQVPAEPPVPAISSATMREITEKLGADAYVDGSLVKLGTMVRVTVVLRDSDGAEIDARDMEAKTEDDLVTVLERIAAAFATGASVGATLNLDNATKAETQDLPERFKLEVNLGAILGQAFSLTENTDHYTMIAFDARLEMNDVLVEANVGFSIAPDRNSNDTSMQMLVGLAAAYYLSHTPISPYIGAGAGIFFGERLASDDDDYDDYSVGTTYGDEDDGSSAVGFEAFPLLGIEFLRQTRIRVHMDFRYDFNWLTTGEFGHGPMVLIGINF